MSDPPYRSTISTCADCGRTYSNLYAHIEECAGPPRAVTHPVEPSPSWLRWWREHWMAALFRPRTQSWDDPDA